MERNYPRIDDVVDPLIEQLKDGERPGDKIPGGGYDVRKVRLARWC